jgi:hypothetical protein
MRQLTVWQTLQLALAGLGAWGGPVAKKGACCLPRGVCFSGVAAVAHCAACVTRLRGAGAAPSSVVWEGVVAGGGGAGCAGHLQHSSIVGRNRPYINVRLALCIMAVDALSHQA